MGWGIKLSSEFTLENLWSFGQDDKMGKILSSWSIDTQALQLLTEKLSARMTWRLAEKDFPQLKIERGTTDG